jgi:hypothetical protein
MHGLTPLPNEARNRTLRSAQYGGMMVATFGRHCAPPTNNWTQNTQILGTSRTHISHTIQLKNIQTTGFIKFFQKMRRLKKTT